MNSLTNLKACGTKIHVRINKKEQEDRKTIEHGSLKLELHGSFEFMMYYLQYGEIISCGNDVPDSEITPGRIALLHHKIEDEPERTIGEYQNGDELKWADAAQDNTSWDVCAVINEDGILIPMAKFVFCIDDDPLELKDGEERIKLDFNLGGLDTTYSSKITGKTKGGILLVENEALRKRAGEEDIKAIYTTTVKFVHNKESELKPGKRVCTNAYNRYELIFKGTTYSVLLREFIFGQYN